MRAGRWCKGSFSLDLAHLLQGLQMVRSSALISRTPPVRPLLPNEQVVPSRNPSRVGVKNWPRRGCGWDFCRVPPASDDQECPRSLYAAAAAALRTPTSSERGRAVLRAGRRPLQGWAAHLLAEAPTRCPHCTSKLEGYSVEWGGPPGVRLRYRLSCVLQKAVRTPRVGRADRLGCASGRWRGFTVRLAPMRRRLRRLCRPRCAWRWSQCRRRENRSRSSPGGCARGPARRG